MRPRLAGVLALLALALAPALARADFGLVPGSFQVQNLDAGGQPDLRAGGHPDKLVTSFALNTDALGDADGNMRDMFVEMPTGFSGNARALPTCPRASFTALTCPAESQVGEMVGTFAGLSTVTLPIYNLAPSPGEPAEFGFIALVVGVRMFATVRSDGDYGTSIELRDTLQNVPLTAATITLWGIPADHQTGTTTPRAALLTNPTNCDRVPTTRVRVRSWQQPDVWITATSSAPGPLTGCDQLPFQPSVGVALDSTAADSPSGMELDVSLQQSDDPDGVASSQLRDLALTLPAGVTLSPGVAAGLASCDDAQLGIGTKDAPACPPASKIGTLELTSPLTGPLPGSLYLGRPLPSDPYRVFMTAEGPGFFVKLPGSLQPDPATGRLTAVFDHLPELPFSGMRLRFKDGPRAPLATPAGCGDALGSATLTPYSTGAPVTLPVSATIATGPGGGPCPTAQPFAPQLTAGATPALAGRDSAFSLSVHRPDGDQALDHVALTLPPGLTARLAGVARCDDAQAAAGACPAASRIGSIAVEAGPGPAPLPLSGDAYLTGPYGGAPFGVALVIRALAGPLDLGTIVVRGTLALDPHDGHITIATQPLPQVVAGVPLRLQTIALTIDRPQFMRNPTACGAAQIAATVASSASASSQQQLRFGLGGCRRLGFRPRVSLALGPAAELRDGGRPQMRIGLRPRAGDANMRSVAVTLPRLLTLDQTAASAICSRTQARDGRCPPESQVGTARARTPLLAHALSGPVNVVQPASGAGQPELWTTLRGEGVRLSLRSTLATPHGRPMRSSFVNLPDLPLSGFAMTLRGGAHGVLAAIQPFCGAHGALRLAVPAALRAQSGARLTTRVRVGAHPRCPR